MTQEYKIKKLNVNDVNELQKISRQTFLETFGSQNTAENMAEFLDEAYDDKKLSREIEDPNSSFYFLIVKD